MSVLDRAAPEPDEVVPYADRAEAVIDLFLPSDPADTLVVLVHGGFWRAAYDRIHARPLAAALAADGYAVALPEYRRVGAGGGWPTTCHDVRRAVDALADRRPSRTVLTGHSAGGHLVLWLAATGTPADRVVPLAPVGDLAAALAAGTGGGAVRDFVGSELPVPEADPAVLLGRHRPECPIEVVHGDADDVVPVDNSRGLVARHPWIGLTELRGVGHFELIDPLDAVYPRVRAALDPPTV